VTFDDQLEMTTKKPGTAADNDGLDVSAETTVNGGEQQVPSTTTVS